MQEVQITNNLGVNVALGCAVSASKNAMGWGQGSINWAVDGSYNPASHGPDMTIEDYGNSWIELDLGSEYSNLGSLNLYVGNYCLLGDRNWCPGDTVTFMDGERFLLGVQKLPTFGTGVTMPYTIALPSILFVLSSTFRILPYTDLAGIPFATSLGSTLLEWSCARTCLNTPPCQGYTWAAPAVLASNPCYLFTNVTSYGINTLTNSGVLWSAAPLGADAS